MSTIGISWPRYCTTVRSPAHSTDSAATSSRRVTSPSGTALGAGEPARNRSRAVFSSEPVSLGEILIEAGQDTQDTPEIGQLDHVLCCFAALLEVPGQAPVAVGERAERGLDPPPDRQGREAAGGGVAA